MGCRCGILCECHQKPDRAWTVSYTHLDVYKRQDNDYPVFSSIDKCDVDADVVIDFSNAKAVDGVLDYCVDKQVPVVDVYKRQGRYTWLRLWTKRRGLLQIDCFRKL